MTRLSDERLARAVESSERRAKPGVLSDRPIRPRDKYLYVIVHWFTGAMKVGMSNDPYRRATEFSPIRNEFTECEVLAVTYGDADDERTLHWYLRNLRCPAPNCMVSGANEWFLPGHAITHIIATWGPA